MRPASANTPAAAATMAGRPTTRRRRGRVSRSGVSSPRVSGTDETSAIDVAVTATSSEAIRYAYENVVGRPAPSPLAKR